MTHTHLDAIQHFVDKLDPRVLVYHLFHVPLSGPRGQAGVEWDQQQHDTKSGEDGRPHGEVEEDQGEDDLKRSRPERMKVRSKVHEYLSIHRHQVDNLSHCSGLPSLVAETKSLQQKIHFS